MGFHHTALATRDLQATHTFYTEAMGFVLVKVIVAPTPEGGWAKHAFYEISADEFIAFWDLHDDTLPATWSPAISTGMGLPLWVNHLAFRAADVDDLAARRRRWTANGLVAYEIDHGWCRSIYTVDPNGIFVEFCTTTAVLTAADRAQALQRLTDPKPPFDGVPDVIVHQPSAPRAAAAR